MGAMRHPVLVGLAALTAALLSGCGKKDEGRPPRANDAGPLPTGERAVRVLGVGTPAPDFTAPAHDGSTVTISALKGKPVVLYFYPKDETPG